ncbi:hypothetical protein ACFL6N_06570 [Thermodesulfobacteriota bacterium]
MKKLILASLAILLLATSTTYAGSSGANSSQDNFVKKRLQDLANQMYRNCPSKMDSETRLDKVTPGPGRRFNYFVTAMENTSDTIDISSIQEVTAPKIFNEYCSSVNFMYKYDVTLSYTYYGNDGNYIGKFEITPDDCP